MDKKAMLGVSLLGGFLRGQVLGETASRENQRIRLDKERQSLLQKQIMFNFSKEFVRTEPGGNSQPGRAWNDQIGMPVLDPTYSYTRRDDLPKEKEPIEQITSERYGDGYVDYDLGIPTGEKDENGDPIFIPTGKKRLGSPTKGKDPGNKYERVIETMRDGKYGDWGQLKNPKEGQEEWQFIGYGKPVGYGKPGKSDKSKDQEGFNKDLTKNYLKVLSNIEKKARYRERLLNVVKNAKGAEQDVTYVDDKGVPYGGTKSQVIELAQKAQDEVQSDVNSMLEGFELEVPGFKESYGNYLKAISLGKLKDGDISQDVKKRLKGYDPIAQKAMINLLRFRGQ